MTKYEYYTPLDVASMLRTESDIALFFEYMIVNFTQPFHPFHKHVSTFFAN